MEILGCTVPASILESWCHRIVYERQPFYLTEPALRLLPSGLPVYSRAEFSANNADAPMDLVDSYELWNVDRSARWVALLTPGALGLLPADSRTALLRLQWELGRGQIYALSLARQILADWPEALANLTAQVFDTPSGPHLALDHGAWWRLPPPGPLSLAGRVRRPRPGRLPVSAA